MGEEGRGGEEREGDEKKREQKWVEISLDS